jgi:ATP-dependent helicase HrpB
MAAYACIEPEQLLERPELNEEVRREWRAEDGSVQELSQLRFGQLVLEESRRRAAPGPETAAILLQGALQSSWWRELQEHFDNFTARCTAAGLAAPDRERWLEEACAERTSLRQLEELKDPGHSLPRDQRYRLERACPAYIQLNRRRYPIHYEVGKPPWVAAPLVEFFNLNQGPMVNEKPLTLHLLAPNKRPVQITSDLAGFWQRHYPKIRQELCRRYPRHPWPEDPLKASLDWKPAR